MAWTTPATWASEDWNIQIRDNLNHLHAYLPPIGSIIMYGRSSTEPTGWRFCQGQIVSQSGTYAALYSVIQGSYNTGGEGAGNFRLPNFTGRFPRGHETLTPVGSSGGGYYDHYHPSSTNPSYGLGVTVDDLANTTYSGGGGEHNHGFQIGATAHDHGHVASGNTGNNIGSGTTRNVAVASHTHSFDAVNNNHDHNFVQNSSHSHTIGHGHGASIIGNTGWMTGNSPPDYFDFEPPFQTVMFIIRYE